MKQRILIATDAWHPQVNGVVRTLDTTTRKVVFERMPFLMSDTVGFIRKLPHHVIESFKSTLDEVREADILIHVIDISHPKFEDQLKVVNETIADIGASGKPTIYVFNKMDLYTEKHHDPMLPDEIRIELKEELETSWQKKSNNSAVFISATKKEGVTELRNIIQVKVQEQYEIRYPYKKNFF